MPSRANHPVGNSRTPLRHLNLLATALIGFTCAGSLLADPGKYHPGYDKDAGYEIAGFVWFQAWNDLINGFYQSDFEKNRTKEGEYLYAPYARLMASFIRDVRKDFKVPAMLFVLSAIPFA